VAADWGNDRFNFYMLFSSFLAISVAILLDRRVKVSVEQNHE